MASTARNLYQFGDIKKLLTGQTPSLDLIPVNIAASMFSLSLFRSLSKPKDFRRTDEDWEWLAAYHIALGDFIGAIRSINKVRVLSPTGYALRVIAMLGTKQLAKANEAARTLLTQRGELPNLDNVYAILLDRAWTSPIPFEVVELLLTQAFRESVSDALLADKVRMLVIQNPSFSERLWNVIEGSRSSFPLTVAVFQIHTQRFKEAVPILSAATPGTEIDEISRVTWLLAAQILDPSTESEQDVKVLRAWLRDELPAIRAAVDSLKEAWEKFLAYVCVASVIEFAKEMDFESVPELESISEKLKQDLSLLPEYELAIKAIDISLQDHQGRFGLVKRVS